MARRSYGTGSLFVRADAAGREKWVGQWRSNGRLVKRVVGPKRGPHGPGLTRRDAEERLRLLMAEDDTAARATITIRALHDRYIADRGRRLKATTISDYTSIVTNHLGPYSRSGPSPRCPSATFKDSSIT